MPGVSTPVLQGPRSSRVFCATRWKSAFTKVTGLTGDNSYLVGQEPLLDLDPLSTGLDSLHSVCVNTLWVVDQQFGEPLNLCHAPITTKTGFVFFPSPVWHNCLIRSKVSDLMHCCLNTSGQNASFCEWFFVFKEKWVKLYSLLLLLCWLHVCFPQAGVRGQKGEKGEPAVLEPVSYWLGFTRFLFIGSLSKKIMNPHYCHQFI